MFINGGVLDGGVVAVFYFDGSGVGCFVRVFVGLVSYCVFGGMIPRVCFLGFSRGDLFLFGGLVFGGLAVLAVLAVCVLLVLFAVGFAPVDTGFVLLWWWRAGFIRVVFVVVLVE